MDYQKGRRSPAPNAPLRGERYLGQTGGTVANDLARLSAPASLGASRYKGGTQTVDLYKGPAIVFLRDLIIVLSLVDYETMRTTICDRPAGAK